jgi:hypothetical protein
LWKVSRFKDSTSLWQESSEGRTFYCWNPGRDRWFHDGFLSGCNGGAFCQDTEMLGSTMLVLNASGVYGTGGGGKIICSKKL